MIDVAGSLGTMKIDFKSDFAKTKILTEPLRRGSFKEYQRNRSHNLRNVLEPARLNAPKWRKSLHCEPP